MKSAFFLLGLISLASTAIVTYSYTSGNCNGNPTSATFAVLDKCIKNANNPSVSRIIVNDNGFITTRSYQTGDCTGTFAIANTDRVNNCTFVLLGGSRIAKSENSFSDAPGGSDTITVSYSEKNCLPTSVYSGTVKYADSCSSSKVELCSNSDQTSSPTSSQVFCGAGFQLPNSGSSVAVAFTLILSIVLFLF